MKTEYKLTEEEEWFLRALAAITEGSGRFTNYLFFDKFRKKWDKQINNFVKRGLIEKDADTIKGYVFWTLTNQAKEEFSDITKFK